MPSIDDYYGVLELRPGSGMQEISRAHRIMAKVWDPARFAHDEILRDKAKTKMRMVEKAYAALKAFNESGIQPDQDADDDYAWYGPTGTASADFEESIDESAEEAPYRYLALATSWLLFGFVVNLLSGGGLLLNAFVVLATAIGGGLIVNRFLGYLPEFEDDRTARRAITGMVLVLSFLMAGVFPLIVRSMVTSGPEVVSIAPVEMPPVAAKGDAGNNAPDVDASPAGLPVSEPTAIESPGAGFPATATGLPGEAADIMRTMQEARSSVLQQPVSVSPSAPVHRQEQESIEFSDPQMQAAMKDDGTVYITEVPGSRNTISNASASDIVRPDLSVSLASSRAPALAEKKPIRPPVYTDSHASLMWAAGSESSGKLSSFADAAAIVADMNRKAYAGHADWRIPTIEELRALYRKTASSSDAALFRDRYISSTETLTGSNYVYAFDFRTGKAAEVHKELTHAANVLAVRPGGR